MFTDAFDRFGTSLEHRYSKRKCKIYFKKRLENILFNEHAPFGAQLDTKNNMCGIVGILSTNVELRKFILRT